MKTHSGQSPNGNRANPYPSAPDGHRPFLPPQTEVQSSPTGMVRPQTGTVTPRSTVHFLVTPELAEVVAYAEARGWLERGWSTLSIRWLELHYTADGWKTPQVLRSTDVPCPVVNGHLFIPNVPAGTEVEFAVHIGVGCRAPADSSGVRDEGDFWMNDGGRNYRQRSR